jgi:hypothetical protein
MVELHCNFKNWVGPLPPLSCTWVRPWPSAARRKKPKRRAICDFFHGKNHQISCSDKIITSCCRTRRRNARMLIEYLLTYHDWPHAYICAHTSSPKGQGVSAEHGPSSPCALLPFMIKPFKFMPGVSHPSAVQHSAAPFGGVLSPSVTRLCTIDRVHAYMCVDVVWLTS